MSAYILPAIAWALFNSGITPAFMQTVTVCSPASALDPVSSAKKPVRTAATSVVVRLVDLIAMVPLLSRQPIAADGT